MTRCLEDIQSSPLEQTEIPSLQLTYRTATIDEAVAHDAPYLKVVGAGGSGKTEFLVRKVASLLTSGIAPEKICVVVGTTDAARAFRMRLELCTKEASRVLVTPLAQLCVGILDKPAARAATGRIPRVLNDAEYKFILEDMKVLGQQPNRLRKMLHYFYFQWSQLEPESEWLLPQEEAGVREALDTHLRLRAAMLREELSPVCAAFLASEAGRANAGQYSCVLVDDYQNLNRASQRVCELLAEKMLIIAGNENQTVEYCDPFPFEEGLTRFELDHEGAACVQLAENLRCPASVAALGNGLCRWGNQRATLVSEVAGSSLPDALMQVKWGTPEEELPGLARIIASYLARDESRLESDVFVVAPNQVWAKMMARTLRERRIESVVVGRRQPLGGDPRYDARSGALRAYTRLNLLADATDVVAWRSWCGFDDYLCYSGAWTRLESWVAQRGISIISGLEALVTCGEPPFLEAEILRDRYIVGQEFLEAAAGKQGFSLVKMLSQYDTSGVFSELIGSVEGDESARDLYAHASPCVLDQSFGGESRKVRIGSYENMQGLSPRLVVVSGLIDGFMPSRDCFDVAIIEGERELTRNTQRRVFYQAVMKPSEQLILSTIQKTDLEMAERMKMEVRRVKMEQGERKAILSPSVFIEEAGEAVPGAVAGEQVLGLQ